jgi:hypothetical protein
MEKENKERKRGKLSKAEEKYIKENCFDLGLQEIADAINRTVEPVKKYLERANLKGRETTDYEHLVATLRSRPYYIEIRKQLLDEDEVMYFENQWIEFFRQFQEDVTHSEEMQIIEVVRCEFLINRSMKDRKEIMQNIVVLENLINDEMAKDKDERDVTSVALFQQQLGSMIGAKSSYINEYEKLVTKKERYLKDLKGTREQRKKVADDATTNFSQWLRIASKLANKEKEGFDMEVQAIAADKARASLAEFHQYEDGEVDQPLLNMDTLLEPED